MKLLTLNTHSLQVEDYPEKLTHFVQAVLDLRPDVIAMQEVNQLRAAAPMDAQGREGYVPSPASGIPLRRGNHAAETARLLRAGGLPCSWTWLPVKLGYGKYDEGLALFSFAGAIAGVEHILLSPQDDYDDWRTRKALAVRLEGRDDWFCSVHMGWWKDGFAAQWARLEAALAEARRQGPVWLLGDFNAPAHVPEEGYDLIRQGGWQDVWALSGGAPSGGLTVPGEIDGWRDQPGSGGGMRIDYIWCSRPADVKHCRVAFDGAREPVVSDHFGVLAEIREELG